jgi:hypothetical protein
MNKKPITVPQHGNCVAEHNILTRGGVLLHGPNSTQETFHGLKLQNFSTTDEKGKDSVLEKQALKVTTSLKSLRQDFKASKCWAVGSMSCKGLVLHQKSTLVQKASHVLH